METKKASILASIEIYVETGQIDKLEELLSDKNIDYDHVIFLKKLIEFNKYNIFQIVTKYMDIDVPNEEGNTLLLEFIFELENYHDEEYQSYNLEIENKILYVLDFVKEINNTNYNGEHALYCYVDLLCTNGCVLNENKVKILKKMLEKGADIRGEDPDELSVINVSVCNANVLKIILENARISNERVFKTINVSMLHNIIDCLHYTYDAIELLLPHIDDINGKNNSTRRDLASYIHSSYYYDNDISPEVRELLIENGARLDLIQTS